MSNIDKLALPELRERFEAWWEVNYHNGNPPRFGWAAWRDGDGYKIDDDESELDGMWQAWQAAHSGKLEAAEERIAELHGQKRLIGWRMADYTDETADPALAKNWASAVDVLPIFEGDVNTKLSAAAAGKGEES